MKHEALGGFVQFEAIDQLVILADHPESSCHQRLGLTPGEKGRPVNPGKKPHFAGDGTDLVHGPSVSPSALVDDERPHGSLHGIFHGGLYIGLRFGKSLEQALQGLVRGDTNSLAPGFLFMDLYGLVDLPVEFPLDPGVYLRVGLRFGYLDGRLPGPFGHLDLGLDQGVYLLLSHL